MREDILHQTLRKQRDEWRAEAFLLRRKLEKLQELRDALEPFERVYRIIDALPRELLDDEPLHPLLPHGWPRWGDLRRIHDVLKHNDALTHLHTPHPVV